MADHQSKGQESETTAKVNAEESTNRGMFDFLTKKEDKKPQEDVVITDVELMEVEEKPTLMEELHRSQSNSSSSSDEEDGGEKKKKGLKEKIKEKISSEKEEEGSELDTSIPVEKDNETTNAEVTQPEEKKGFIEKIKEKLPGQQKKVEEGGFAECAADGSPEDEAKEKKGFLEKIKEKLPGCHKNEDEKNN